MSARLMLPFTQGLTPVPFQLNLSTLYGPGGARSSCVARIKRVFGGVQGVQGVLLRQTRLNLS